MSGLAAALLTESLPGGLWSCLAVLGSLGALLGLWELLRRNQLRLA